MFSKFFINRPIFATVISLIIILAGVLSMNKLAVEEYPQVTPPQVTVMAQYPGASAATVAQTVAPVLEEAINGTQKMLYIKSSSSNGMVSMSIFFEIGTDVDDATIDVNNRVQAVSKKLPEEVQRLGVTVRKRGSNFLEIVALSSPDDTRDPVFLSNYALINVVDELKRVSGVGDVMLFGSKDYSFRIWFYPDLLAKYNLTPNDVIAAIKEQNSQFAAGKFGEEPMKGSVAFTYSVKTPSRLATVQEFENIVLRVNADTSFLRLRDVAKVELGAQNYDFDARKNKKAVIPIGIFMQPDANALQTAQGIEAKMQELSKKFPSGVSYDVPYDTTRFVEISINEVIKTFIEAIVLVVLVIYLFLGSLRATIIPVLAVPVSIIGAFAGIYALGFSINLLTLFGLVLAIGIVVDDAIIVIENVERNIREFKIGVKEATTRAMNEVGSAVVSIVLVLAAVFIPVSFMGGFTGQMYKQFALTIVISVAISGFVALTLTPALCAVFLKEKEEEPFWFIKKFNEFFDLSTRLFSKGVQHILRRGLIFVLITLIIMLLGGGLFGLIPKSLVPSEDKGSIFALTYLPPASSLQRTVKVRDNFSDAILQNPHVESVMGLAGFDLVNSALKSDSGVMFIKLKDWSQRTKAGSSSQEIAASLTRQFFFNKEAMVFALNPPPIAGLSITGGFEMYLQDKGGKGYEALYAMAQKIVQASGESKILTSVRTNLNPHIPQYDVSVNREKAKMLGVHLASIFSALQATIGTYYVNDFNLYGRTFKVNIQADGDFRKSPQDLDNIFVRSDKGQMVALSSLLEFKRTTGADTLERFNLFPAAKITGEPARGYSSGDAMKEIERIVNSVIDENYALSWSGSSYQENQIGSSSLNAFLFAMLFVFLVLSAQYERWLMPLAVLTAIPFSIFGAVLAVYLSGLTNDIYFQIGLVMLIALSAKNAILIVEFAMQKRDEGMDIVKASIEAAKLRFRPIVMTSLAFTIGVIPLVLSSGAGAASRHSIGTGVLGGMIAASTIAIFFVPLFYVYLEKFNKWFRSKRTNNA